MCNVYYSKGLILVAPIWLKDVGNIPSNGDPSQELNMFNQTFDSTARCESVDYHSSLK